MNHMLLMTDLSESFSVAQDGAHKKALKRLMEEELE